VNRLAVLGFPVSHSRSPAMQNAALAAMGLGEEWSYGAIDVAPDGFERRVREIAGEGFVGANVTVPHKGAALVVADELSEIAREVGAANTLIFSGHEIRAENTDAQGLLNALPGSPNGQRALVLGAGGAARAVVWALAREGAEIDVWNRTERRSRDLCTELGGRAVADPDPSAYELIVNSTAVGLHGEDPFDDLPLTGDAFAKGQTVVDMVYGGEPTQLLQAAVATGAAVVDGIEILVQQGALSLQIWTGHEPPIDVMRAAARA
jgi:shikimate dehydrogenase